ncbi:hypothetical protein SAMN04489712_119104 [Thermomonospora echinospora]|uniref:Uncharacterized protein n=1 Tax=Thermomonospora echinospora TaxID=1992 RepID=A0A1H6DMZ1_9ACTN|nr:hypothetical protein [Thermomonospora echinospora]SEG86531.1 hypothetical protein SAMN04489712_119104 [Thermomonospora echinospora]
MTAAAWSLCLALVLAGLSRINWPVQAVSPDGRRYLTAGSGRPVSLPFMLRWLLPRLCGDSLRRWRWCTTAHLVALPPLVTVWMAPWVADDRLRVIGGLLLCGMPGIWRIQLRWPVLVDGTAMAWALGSAICFQHGLWVPGIAAVLVSGCVKETAPVFAACFAWHWVALVGLAAPLVRRLTGTIGEDLFGQPDLLKDPWRAGSLYHAGKWFDPLAMLTPWGAGLLAALSVDTRIAPMLIVTVALAYAQLLIATDTARLYQWAAPPVVLGAVQVMPSRWAIAILIVHLCNPWAGSAET